MGWPRRQPFLPIEELLCGIEEEWEPHNAVKGVEHGNYKLDSAAEYHAPIGYDNTSASEATRSGGTYKRPMAAAESARAATAECPRTRARMVVLVYS